ncbi:putative O-linked N-acetylglucosamine transferase, SPINDLY family [Methylophilaceae bacterium 11]|nr:putative O-linked N-acetylglucosamine transferase, SPINDLY family [Methylophilaceae bacterium 11]
MITTQEQPMTSNTMTPHTLTNQPMAAAGKSKGIPSPVVLNQLIQHFNQGAQTEAQTLALALTQEYPKHGMAWKILGVIYQQVSQLEAAEQALKHAAELLPKDPEAQYNYANCLYDLRKLQSAQSYYQKAIKLAPQFVQALFNLADVQKELKQWALAEANYRKAFHLAPQHVHMHFNFGVVLQEQGKHKEAIKQYEKALNADADNASIHLNLGAAYKALGELALAEQHYRTAIRCNPAHVGAHNNLGIVLKALERNDESEQAYLQAIAIDESYLPAYKNLGMLYKETGQVQAAEHCYIKALSLEPPTAETLNNMGVVMMNQGRYAEAEEAVRKALDLAPKLGDAWNNLGLILQAKMVNVEAEQAFEQALKFQPNDARTLSNYSVTLKLLGKLSQAEACLKKAISKDPHYADAYLNLGNIYLDQGMIAEAIASTQRVLAIAPNNVSGHDNLLFAMTYSDDFTPEARLEIAHQYGQLTKSLAHTPYAQWNVSAQDQRLRVGLVSGDLRQHPVAYFLKAWLAHVDPNKIELFAYSTDGREDATTATLKPYFAHWQSLAGHNDQAAAAMIHADQLHILLDLSGHTGGNKLPLFAWNPAPVQASWLGYWATTGIQAMDYVLVDAVGVPTEHQAQFTETIQYLPDTRMCFTAPEQAPEVAALPALHNGYITFGCFQNMTKVSDDVLKVWAEIMQALPTAKLRWQSKSFADAHIVAAVHKRLQQCGIAPARVTLLGKVSRQEYLAGYADVDMVLDSFPFTGGTTTCEALWMGVPTLTLAGSTLIARQGASMMSAAGLVDWVVNTPAQYVQQALHLAKDISKLTQLRAGLRAQVQHSPLMDGQRFAHQMETVLRGMWESKAPQLAKFAQISHVASAAAQDNKQALTSNVQLTVEVISATRMTEQAFWQASALGQSLKTHMANDSRIAVRVAYENSRGLPEIFNTCIAQADDDAVLVFVHDDVWLDQPDFVDAVLAGLNQFDVIGVAGNKRRLPKQPAWPFINTQFVWDDHKYLSGKVGHGEHANGEVSDYGAVPAACELMDGVFFATKKATLAKHQVAFDTQFDFHFYDLDFCRSARNAGMTLGTWHIQLTHQSGGAFGSESWQRHYQGYLQKWQEQDLPDNDVAAALDIHTFELTTVDDTVKAFKATQLYPAAEYTTQIIPIFGKPSPNPLVQSTHVLQHPPIYMAEVTNFKVIGSAAFPIVQDKCIQPQNFTPETWETAEQGLGYCSVRTDINLVGYANLGELVDHDCKVISLIGNGAINYAHWLTEFLPQIVVLQQAGVDISQYHILVDAQSYPSQLESLYLLGVSPEQLIMVAPFSLHHFPQAMWLSPIANVVFQRPKASHGVGKDITSAPDRAIYHPAALLALRNAMLDKMSTEIRATQAEKIFIRRTRGNAINARLLVNEQAIEALLVANGFVGIDPSALGFLEQVTAFSNAKYIVAASGAAILNMLWAPADAHVLVMMNDTRYANYWYFGNVASPIGQTLTYILGETLEAQLGGDVVHSNFTIDPQAVLDALQYRGLTDVVHPAKSLHDALQEVLDLAIEQQNAGDLVMAEQLYQEVLNVQPHHAEANHHLAIIETHTERLAEAIPRFELAIAANPAHEQYWVSYVDALMLAGNVDKAVKTLEIGQQFGLSAETAQQLAAEFVAQLEAQPPQNDVVSGGQAKPILATLVPAYKHAFIPQLLVSLATQSYPTGQIIISDDSPNGEVSQVIADPALAHIVEKLDITIIPGPKQGTMSNVVHLLEHWQQSSQLVHILFDDDILYPTFYAEHVQAHTQEAIGASVSYRWFTNELGQPYAASAVPAFVQQSTNQTDFIGADQLFASVVPTCDNWLGEFSNTVFSADAVQLYKRSRLEDIAYYGLGDVGLLLEISLYAKVALIKNYLGGFRQNAQQNTVNYDSPVFKCGTVAWVALALASYRLGKISAQQLQQSVQLIQGAVNARFQQSADMQGFIQLFNTHASDSAAFEQNFLPLWQQLLACKDWLHAQQIGQFA